MKQFIKILIFLLLPLKGISQDCEINLSALPMQNGDNVPENISDLFVTKLTQAVTANGIAADAGFNQFFVSGKFNHLYTDATASAPVQTIVKTMLTLYIGDLQNNQIYATESMELSGVGQNFDRAYVNVLSRVNGQNEKLKNLIKNGKTKILEYYNKNTPQILAKADKAAALQNYDEAIYYLVAIPECCSQYQSAKSKLLDMFQKKLDFDGKIFLQKAQSAWNINPTIEGANEAVKWLNEINPQSSAYPDAVKLGNEIRKTVKSDIDFEVRDKYHDEIELEKQLIDAARQVGKAYGEGQKPTTTNLLWVK